MRFLFPMKTFSGSWCTTMECEQLPDLPLLPRPFSEHQQPAFTRLGLNFTPHLIPRVNKELCECPRKKTLQEPQLPGSLAWLWVGWLDYPAHNPPRVPQNNLCKHWLTSSQIVARIHNTEIFRAINCWHMCSGHGELCLTLFYGVVF